MDRRDKGGWESEDKGAFSHYKDGWNKEEQVWMKEGKEEPREGWESEDKCVFLHYNQGQTV